MNADLVDRIETLAGEKGLSLNRIERTLGLGNGTIRRWKHQSPRLDRLLLVAQCLDVSLDFLVSGTGTAAPMSSQAPATIGSRIRSRRHALGLTLKQVAARKAPNPAPAMPGKTALFTPEKLAFCPCALSLWSALSKFPVFGGSPNFFNTQNAGFVQNHINVTYFFQTCKNVTLLRPVFDAVACARLPPESSLFPCVSSISNASNALLERPAP